MRLKMHVRTSTITIISTSMGCLGQKLSLKQVIVTSLAIYTVAYNQYLGDNYCLCNAQTYAIPREKCISIR